MGWLSRRRDRDGKTAWQLTIRSANSQPPAWGLFKLRWQCKILNAPPLQWWQKTGRHPAIFPEWGEKVPNACLTHTEQ